METDQPIDPTGDDARRLLTDAGVSLTGPGETATGFSRVALCEYLLEWAHETGDPDAPVTWETPLQSLLDAVDDADEAGWDGDVCDWLRSSEVGSVVVCAEAAELRTFGDALLYVEGRLAEVRRDPTETEILDDLRVQIATRGGDRNGVDTLTPEAATESLFPWVEADRDGAFRDHLTRRYGADLPYGDEFVGSARYSPVFLSLWAVLIVVGGCFLWQFGLWAIALWVVVSPLLLQFVLSSSSRKAWPPEARTLGDLARYVRNANRVTLLRAATALGNDPENEEDEPTADN